MQTKNWVDEFLKGLPVRLAEWLEDDERLRHLLWKLVSSVLLVFGGYVVAGIVEGVSFSYWESAIAPWLTAVRPGITNGMLTVIGLISFSAVALALVMTALAMLIYGADRRRLGQLERVGNENAERAERIDQLNIEIGSLRDCLERSREADGELLELFSAMDRELLLLLTNCEAGAMDDAPFIEGICRRLFQAIGPEHSFRAGVYLVDSEDPDYLTIYWDYGVGAVSRRVNRWYIGSIDPRILGVHRGILGEVFVQGQGRVNVDVRTDPDFHDPYVPQRSHLPYRSTLHALVHPNNVESIQGVLCLDSQTHEFTEGDLAIAQQVAIRLGWLFYAINREDQAESTKDRGQ